MNYCYLDTNIFHGKNKGIINFTNLNFKYLTVLASYNICRLIVPEVMKIELYAHFKEKIREFDNKVKEIGLPTSLIDSLGNIRNTESIYNELVCEFESFLQATHTVELPMNELNINASELVKLRYDSKAPFTPAKQNEYQDLFIIMALQKFIIGHENDKLIIISKDKGFVEYCKSMMPADRVMYYTDLSEYRPLNALTDIEKEVQILTQNYFENAYTRLQEYLENVLLDSCIDLPCPYELYALEEQFAILSNPIVKSIDIFEEEIYAYIVCDCIYQASGKGINEEQSEYNWSTHSYNTLVHQNIEVHKQTEVLFIVNLFALTDEKGTIYDIDCINDIEVSNDPFSSISVNEIKATIDSIVKQENPFL